MSTRSKVTIYTDGSCLGNPGPGGWAAILIHNATETVKEISGGEAYTTNNRMEITAAIEALSAMNIPVEANIFTDSTYLQNAFTKGWLNSWMKRGWVKANKKPVENADLWKKLLQVSEPHLLTWHYVKAHVGHRFNERCDELAKAQASKYSRNR